MFCSGPGDCFPVWASRASNDTLGWACHPLYGCVLPPLCCSLCPSITQAPVLYLFYEVKHLFVVILKLGTFDYSWLKRRFRQINHYCQRQVFVCMRNAAEHTTGQTGCHLSKGAFRFLQKAGKKTTLTKVIIWLKGQGDWFQSTEWWEQKPILAWTLKVQKSRK